MPTLTGSAVGAGAARADRPSLFARSDAVIPLVVNVAPVVVNEEALSKTAGDGVVKRFVALATQKEAADGVLERYSNTTDSGSKAELTEILGLPRPNSLLPMYSDASHSVSPEPLR